MLLQSPDGHNTLIDAGLKRGRLDRGHLQVVPYLRRQGVEQLDLIIMTHADMDHIGGIPSLLREIGLLWLSASQNTNTAVEGG